MLLGRSVVKSAPSAIPPRFNVAGPSSVESGSTGKISARDAAGISEKPLAIPAAGLDYALPTDKPGDYALLVIRGSDDKEVNRIAWTVAGAANVSRSLDRNAELQLNLDKHDYKPGEAVQIAIHAPYTGSGLPASALTIISGISFSGKWKGP